MARQLCAGVLLMLSVGCGYNRVTLRQVPEKTAPVEERIAAAKDLLPESGLQTTYLRNGVVVGQHINHIMLGDGTRVEDPRDLLPAVEDNSATAGYIKSYEGKASTAKALSWASLGAYVGGTVLMLAPLALPHEPGKSFTDGPGLPMLITGGGIAFAGTIVMLIGGFYGGSAQQDRVSAFETYPKALVKKLDLRDDDAPKPDPKKPAKEVRAPMPSDAPLRLALAPL